ncbi:MAG TPA: lysylphosphatidylglycerol synthase transmembrane domain-containing protein [Clostridia bacterium]|nr:lysylphosphatidylglycerol synthase transmembrane domain-containing protein [Clostridia bacterium]
MNRKKWTLVYIVLNILLIALIGVLDPEIKDVGKIFRDVRLSWITGGVLLMLIFWLMDGIILSYAVKVISRTKAFWGCLRVSLIGQYYNAVTPFASGGQPAQVYYMGKLGVSGGSASSVLMIKFLIYQVVLSLYCLAAFIWKGITIYNHNPWVFWFSVVGFIINAGAVVLLVSLSFNKGFVEGLVFKTIDILGAIRLIKDTHGMKERLISHVEDFHEGLKFMRGNARAILTLGMMTAIQLICFFSITFFIYRALGLEGEKWINVVSVQSLLYLAVSFVPTPGSMGASETGYIAFFRLFFPGDLIFVSMLLWRAISYYLNILAGVIIILLDSLRQIVSHDVAN